MVTLEISSTPQRYRRMCITATVHPNHPSRAAGGTPMLYSTVYWTVILHVVLTQAIKCNCFDLQCCVFETCWRKWHKANKSPNLQIPQRRNQKKKKNESSPDAIISCWFDYNSVPSCNSRSEQMCHRFTARQVFQRASMFGHGALPSPLPELLWLTHWTLLPGLPFINIGP